MRLRQDTFEKEFVKEFREGRSRDCYRYLGNHCVAEHYGDDACSDRGSVSFSVWAPNAQKVYVTGDFNNWNCADEDTLMTRDKGGIWHIDLDCIGRGERYKYCIVHEDGSMQLKADPMALQCELRPGTASIVGDMHQYQWNDEPWLMARESTDYRNKPVNIYEMHLGSWRRAAIPGIDYEVNWQEAERRRSDEPFYNYRELADLLVLYLRDMNYTHVEIMPLCEHPLDGSWGYQTGNYYALTSRYGTPEDFCYFVDRMHEYGIGVILDWVPGHFCKDDAWLYRFDGTWQYEYDNELLRENPNWGTANFDLSKGEVRSFLISNAIMWLKEYHVDGLRVDAVANLLYLDYDNFYGKTLRNRYGGDENIDGINFIRELNIAVHEVVEHSLMIAEDSSAWPMVTRPCYLGGLGFDFKWNMGWMNDTLEYMGVDPVFRSSVHNKMTFSLVYAFSEHYILPISHDEVVHGKKTLLGKMFGHDNEQRFAAMRAYLMYMIGHSGKKLMFMGNEFGQYMEWRYYEALEWKMLLYPPHAKLKEYVRSLNYIYLHEKALYELDDSYDGFQWIDADNAPQNVFSFIRKSNDDEDFLVFVINMSPVSYDEYKIGVPRFADYKELISADDKLWGGSGMTNDEIIRPGSFTWNGQPFHISIKLPSYGAMIFKPQFRRKETRKNIRQEKLYIEE